MFCTSACAAAKIRADRRRLSPHRPEPGFQPPVIVLDWVVRVALDSVQRGGDQLVEDPRIGGCPVSGDLGRDRCEAQRAGKEPAGRAQVTPRGQQHVDDLAILVDRPVQVRPPASDLDMSRRRTIGHREHDGTAGPPR
jgi:hypothetical protein